LKYFNFTQRQLCIKVANMVLCGNVFILFSDNGPLRIETCTNVKCDIINI